MKVKTCSTIKYFDFFFQITKIFHVNTQITKVPHYSQKYICFKQTKKNISKRMCRYYWRIHSNWWAKRR